MNNINITEIVKNGKTELTHAVAGVLYYRTDTNTHSYIYVIDMNDREDVGTATFEARPKTLYLMRWIRKSIENNTIIVIKKKYNETESK
jgi:outer membrane lipoprotein-sorting protein